MGKKDEIILKEIEKWHKQDIIEEVLYSAYLQCI